MQPWALLPHTKGRHQGPALGLLWPGLPSPPSLAAGCVTHHRGPAAGLHSPAPSRARQAVPGEPGWALAGRACPRAHAPLRGLPRSWLLGRHWLRGGQARLAPPRQLYKAQHICCKVRSSASPATAAHSRPSCDTDTQPGECVGRRRGLCLPGRAVSGAVGLAGPTWCRGSRFRGSLGPCALPRACRFHGETARSLCGKKGQECHRVPERSCCSSQKLPAGPQPGFIPGLLAALCSHEGSLTRLLFPSGFLFLCRQ